MDIQPIAAEISKLRCFLTLVVDEHIDETQPNRGIEPLPNLEFKFITANTLLKLPKEEDHGGLFNANDDLDALQQLRNEYLQSCGEEKAKIKEEFQKIQDGIYMRQLKLLGEKNVDVNSRAYLVSAWKPFSYVRKDSFGEKANWFDPEWMFGVKEFDLVIGNPPYVSLEKIGEIKNQYKKIYEVATGRSDLYCLFYERGLNLCKPESGLLCYITSNKWMRAGYGEPLRKFFASKNPLQLLDFGGFKVFESATVDTNILIIGNKENQNQLAACHFKNDYKRGDELTDYFQKNQVALKQLSKEAWFIGSKSEIELKQKIEKIGTPLKNWDVKINYGIKTGFNEAFIIGQAKRDELVAADPKCGEIIKPILRGRDIKRYSHEWAGLWIIIVKFGEYKILSTQYPAIYQHLKQYETKLKNRGQCRYSRAGKNGAKTDYEGQHHWLELDNNPKDEYIGMFEKEKVVWSDISTEPTFQTIENEMFFNNTAYMISRGKPKYFTGVLNSKIIQFYFPLIATDLGEKGNRYFKQFVELMPIPKITSTNQALATQIETLVDKIIALKKENPGADTANHAKDVTGLEAQIDELVYELYELTAEERKIIW